jgi:hypothetical protein
MTNVKIHHNYSYNNCGFSEIATYFGDCKGVFADSDIYSNLSIDSAWMGFLQVNNTDFENIHYFNNTSIQHESSLNAGLLWLIYTDTSSGRTGGALVPGTVFLTNNLFVFDGVSTLGDPVDDAFTQTTNLIIYTDEQTPGFVNIDGWDALDYDLTASSPARDAGTLITGGALDFLNRTIPDSGGTADIGAFEFGSSQEVCLPSRSPL